MLREPVSHTPSSAPKTQTWRRDAGLLKRKMLRGRSSPMHSLSCHLRALSSHVQLASRGAVVPWVLEGHRALGSGQSSRKPVESTRGWVGGRGEHHTSPMENIVATWESWSLTTPTLAGTAGAFSLASAPWELQGSGRRARSASPEKPDQAEGTCERSPEGVGQTREWKMDIRD